MPKVTTAVEVKVVIELTLEEAQDLSDELGAKVGGPRSVYDIYYALSTTLENLPTKGVE